MRVHIRVLWANRAMAPDPKVVPFAVSNKKLLETSALLVVTRSQ